MAEQAQIPPLIPTRLWELQETDGASQGLATGCLCALPCSILASVPYAQFKLGVLDLYLWNCLEQYKASGLAHMFISAG